MKLLINSRDFQRIKKGEKFTDYRDAHITFVDESTRELFTKKVIKCSVISPSKNILESHAMLNQKEKIMRFYLG